MEPFTFLPIVTMVIIMVKPFLGKDSNQAQYFSCFFQAPVPTLTPFFSHW